MNAARDPHGDRQPEEMLERHRHEEQGQKRQPFEEPDNPELAKRAHHPIPAQVGLKTMSTSTRKSGPTLVTKPETVCLSRVTL